MSWDHAESEIVVPREGSRLFLSCDLLNDTIGFGATSFIHNVSDSKIASPLLVVETSYVVGA